MELNLTEKTLYNTPTWIVLSYILQHPEQAIRGVLLRKALPNISKSALYNTIQQLEKIEVLTREKDNEAYTLNRSLTWLSHMMVTNNLISLQPLVDKLRDLSSKIILFGSRATSDYHSESDYDLFIVSNHENDVRHIIEKNILAEHIQLIIKTPEEWIDFHQVNPELYQSLQQGTVLWERK